MTSPRVSPSTFLSIERPNDETSEELVSQHNYDSIIWCICIFMVSFIIPSCVRICNYMYRNRVVLCFAIGEINYREQSGGERAIGLLEGGRKNRIFQGNEIVGRHG